jgi:hypothetical protein
LKWEAAHPVVSLTNADLPVPFTIKGGAEAKIYFKVTDADHAIRDVELEVESSDEDILKAETVKIVGKATATVRYLQIGEKVRCSLDV